MKHSPKLAILQSLDSMDQVQMENVLQYIKGVLQQPVHLDYKNFQNPEFSAPVLVTTTWVIASIGIAVSCNRLAFTVTFCLQSLRINSSSDEIIHGTFRSALRELKIVSV